MIGRLRSLWSRCRALVTRDRLDREFDEELSTHLELLVDEYRRSGRSAADARREALLRLGRPDLLRETHREQQGVPFLDALAQDLRYACRMLRKRPAFSAVAVISLALGIGANTALFSVVDNLLLRSLPVRDPDRLVQIQRVASGLGIAKKSVYVADEVIQSVRLENTVLDAIVTFNRLERPEIAIEGGLEPGVRVEEVSDNFFRDLGLTPVLGRNPGTSERGVAVLSESLWRTRFGGSPDILAKPLRVDRDTYTIVGVAPERFRGMSIDTPADLWISPRTPVGGTLIARLRREVAPAQARAALEALFDRVDPPAGLPMHVELLPAGKGLSHLRGQVSRPLLALGVLVMLLLLITCANLGHLLVLRNLSRRRELSVRAVLGASRTRLTQQYLVESALLALLGAAGGVLFARWGVSLILSMLPLPAASESLAFHVDLRTLGFAAAATALTAALFAVAPARHAARIDLTSGLKFAHGGTMTRHGRRLGRALVASQVALAVVLLAAAGLFVGTLRNLARLDVGFDPDNLVQVSIDTRGAGYGPGQVGPVHALLLERIAAIPGVASVSSVRNALMRGGLSRTSFAASGEPTIGPDESWDSAEVGPAFFETLKLPIVRGRTFAASEHGQRQPRLIINEAFARQYFPNVDPIGRIGGVIVGVVRDAQIVSVRRPAGPMMYFTLRPEPDRINALEVRTTGAPEAVAPLIRQEVRRVHPRLLTGISTVRGEIERSIQVERMVATISAFFSVLGVLLASIGIFGTAAYSVSQKTNELGIRRALGAGSWSILLDAVRDTMVVVTAGLAAGIAVAVAAIRVTASSFSDLLFGVSAMDVTNIVSAGLLMIAVALAACVLPLRRAIRIDPLTAIRAD